MSPLTTALLLAVRDESLAGPVVAQCARVWRQAGAPDVIDESRSGSLGALLRRCRDAAGFTQRVAAGALGVGQAQLCRWESGERIPDAGELGAMADLYQLSPEQRADALARARRHRAERAAPTQDRRP